MHDIDSARLLFQHLQKLAYKNIKIIWKHINFYIFGNDACTSSKVAIGWFTVYLIKRWLCCLPAGLYFGHMTFFWVYYTVEKDLIYGFYTRVSFENMAGGITNKTGNFSSVLISIGKKIHDCKLNEHNHCPGRKHQSFKHSIGAVALVSLVLEFSFQFFNFVIFNWDIYPVNAEKNTIFSWEYELISL